MQVPSVVTSFSCMDPKSYWIHFLHLGLQLSLNYLFEDIASKFSHNGVRASDYELGGNSQVHYRDYKAFYAFLTCNKIFKMLP